ncbi:hypothetical protein IVA79_08100 [Bradyrhizobium sp. 138]|uniref:hypothetical protein n=1 Tax=Bradyrhizobium sp. 138 TaxID=2782615 RepID=UPI001FF8DD12|nr:hypothetical protein [Bradyrhizobium sp. 138]MCK1733917.1 hypothetical protein [Bradyrhizobium sp. 138]
MKTFIVAAEVLGVIGIFLSFSLLAWTKLTLGSSLAFLAVFFQNDWGKNANPAGGKATIKIGSVSVGLNGGLRFALVIVGLFIVISGTMEARRDTAFAAAKASGISASDLLNDSDLKDDE